MVCVSCIIAPRWCLNFHFWGHDLWGSWIYSWLPPGGSSGCCLQTPCSLSFPLSFDSVALLSCSAAKCKVAWIVIVCHNDHSKCWIPLRGIPLPYQFWVLTIFCLFQFLFCFWIFWMCQILDFGCQKIHPVFSWIVIGEYHNKCGCA